MDGFPYVMYYSKCSILIYLIRTVICQVTIWPSTYHKAEMYFLIIINPFIRIKEVQECD